MQVSAQKKRQFFLGMAVSLLCLGGMFWVIKPADIAQAIQQTNVRYLWGTAIYLLIYLFLRAVRWRFLLGNGIPQAKLFHIQNIGQMLTQLLPFRLGDVARAVLVGQQPDLSVPQGVTTMVVERLLDMLLMVLLLPLVLLRIESLPDWLQQAALISGVATVGLILFLILVANKRPFAHKLLTWLGSKWRRLHNQKFHQQLDNLLDGLKAFTHWRTALGLLGLSLLTWVPVVLAYNTALQAVHLPASIINATFIMIVGAFAVAAPSSPGQIGVFHMGIIAAMTALGLPTGAAASLAILYHAINFLLMVLAGVVGLNSTQIPFAGLTQVLSFRLGNPSQKLTDPIS
ncbi:lysylphosphatidylglycerol synthase transmembrane domain-containing protein [Candidatus Leptofilum sp.]|uniref:lysylphosphatidylglycerol synthase transmembrane domain-containing protein n=1 Tax=Candidatus Leptofilum sp. TaxID=3241576 RepID=UPI003B5AF651